MVEPCHLSLRWKTVGWMQNLPPLKPATGSSQTPSLRLFDPNKQHIQIVFKPGFFNRAERGSARHLAHRPERLLDETLRSVSGGGASRASTRPAGADLTG